MPRKRSSLIAGRHLANLSEPEITRVTNTFLGMNSSVPTRHEEGARTVFRITTAPNGEIYGEIVFGSDIYPGTGMADANSMLSMQAAAAHELTHHYRWQNKLALDDPELEDIDEALTSLQAISLFSKQLGEVDLRQLASDATQRLQLFVRDRSAALAETAGGEPAG